MKKLTIATVALMLALLPTACRKEKAIVDRQFSFNASIEQPTATDGDSKVYLQDEHFIIWEHDDEVSIGSNMTTTGTEGGRAWLSSATGSDWENYNGLFLAELPEGSKYFLALHPVSDNNVIRATGGESADFPQISIELPSVQPYRDDARADYTFDKQVFPMVAWYGGSWTDDPYTPFNLDFHSLGAIVRLQFVNKTGSDANIKKIEVTSDNRQLCGMFTVNNYKTHNPYLTATDNSSNRMVTIDCENVSFPQNDLKTFYLVVPAIAGRETTTANIMTARVYNSSDQYREMRFSVNTRRNGITYMQALEINSWTSGSMSPSISGNGTEDRPFKVYTIEDLQYLRDCYNSVARTINGQPITADTYVKIMRSDIELTTVNWLAGIRNFEGHLLTMNHQSHPGITNSCQNVPLFESIGANGEVVGLTVKCSGTNALTNATGVSPFCGQNDGRIIDCALTNKPGSSDYITSIFSPFAGICVTNNGTLQGCRCEAKVEVQSNKNFAGICLHNNGTIVGCQAGDMTLRDFSANGAGICYENSATGIVKDCYFASNIMNSNADWGGIVYDNSGTVELCYLSATGHIYTSKSVGGIVRNNLKGKVNYCWVAGPLRGKNVGGIVDSLVTGQVVNCFNQSSAMLTVTTATSACGGLVAYMKAGSIENSYVKDITITRQNNAAVVGGIAGVVTGGSMNNCYSSESFHTIYGTTARATYTNCYLVGGSQALVTRYAGDRNYVALCSDLNANVTGDYKGWQQNPANTLPILNAYTVTP